MDVVGYEKGEAGMDAEGFEKWGSVGSVRQDGLYIVSNPREPRP
jgi:hypothetical protein